MCLLHPAQMVEHVWSERTVVLFGKERDSKTRRLREVIADLLIQPSPVLIEVNARGSSRIQADDFHLSDTELESASPFC